MTGFLTGVDRTRARLRGLVIAHGLATGSITTRELTAQQAEVAAWAVQTCLQDTSTLLALQLEAENTYAEEVAA